MAEISKINPNGTTYDLKDAIARGVWSGEVTCAVNATTATITDSSIATTSVVDVYCQNSSGTSICINSIAVTTGQVVLSFDALTEQTKFKVHIFNL